MGRRPKLTTEVVAQAADLLAKGHYVETVASYLGVHPSTWYRWLERGQRAKKGPYREFRDAIARASARAEVDAVESFRAACGEDWRAWLAFLERRYPARWGRRDAPNVPSLDERSLRAAADDDALKVVVDEHQAAEREAAMTRVEATFNQEERRRASERIRLLQNLQWMNEDGVLRNKDSNVEDEET